MMMVVVFYACNTFSVDMKIGRVRDSDCGNPRGQI